MTAGKDLTRDLLLRLGEAPGLATDRATFAYGIIQTAGTALGFLAFGPISTRLGRRRSFVIFQLLAFVIVPIVCFLPQTYEQMLVMLPFYGFLTVGFHSGYAIYFPELFPTHLRATGTSFCFNGGRILAIPVLVLSSWLKRPDGVGLQWAVTLLGTLFLLGALDDLPSRNQGGGIAGVGEGRVGRAFA